MVEFACNHANRACGLDKMQKKGGLVGKTFESLFAFYPPITLMLAIIIRKK